MSETPDTPKKSRRGLAAMSPDKRKAIAAMGGRALAKTQRTFYSDRALAAAAGRRGGQSVPGDKRGFSRDRELAATAGSKGGQASALIRARRAQQRKEVPC